MSLDQLIQLARADALEVIGLCHTVPEDGLGKGTLALLGPSEPGFWAHLQKTPEFHEKAPDPLDRWSTRVITHLADQSGGTALFPFGAPARPFISWALRSERAWTSPVGLLVHDHAGLLVSYRGAVLFDGALPLPEASTRPCDGCESQECLTACPVGALDERGYDLSACHEFLDDADGFPCMSQGCRVRLACPVSRAYPRAPSQTAFHMAAFHGRGTPGQG